MLLATLITSAYPDAIIEDIDPYSQTMRGAGFLFGTHGDVIILSGLGTQVEALDALKRLRDRQHCSPIVLLVSNELITLRAELIAAGAFAVLRKNSLSSTRLFDAIDRALGHTQSPDHFCAHYPAVQQDAEPYYGEFVFSHEGERCVVEIDGYRLVKCISSGPLAQVFLADQVNTGLAVVIKILTASPVHNMNAMGAVRARRSLFDRHTSPSIVRTIDSGIGGTFFFEVMEYLSHGDLRQRMQTPLATDQVVAIMVDLLNALTSLHASGLAHADLKPESIFFHADGHLVLIDFDIATTFGQVVTATAPRIKISSELSILGTPIYTSPEQGAGLPIAASADIYSAGIIFFELLTSVVPFAGDTPAQVIFRHMHDEVPLLPLRVRHLQSVIDKMLAKTPTDRFQTAAAVSDALRTTLLDLSTGQAT